VFVTHNRTDFERLAVPYFEDGRTHKGIICAVRRPPAEYARRLLSLLNERTAEDFENQLLYIWVLRQLRFWGDDANSKSLWQVASSVVEKPP
jgi:hypothetical protein